MTSLADALLSRADHATAAIDWCEKNHAVSPRVAEFWNALSSLAFCAAGASMLAQDWRLPRLRAALRCSGPLLVALGLASAAFHATLALAWQRADEVAENLALVTLLHGALEPAAALAAFALHCAAAAAGVLRIHAFLFTELHLVGSAVGVAFVLSRLARALRARRGAAAAAAAAAVQQRLRVLSAAAALGAAAWLIDRTACPWLPAALNPQLHAWWHVLGALALHEAFAAAALAGLVLDGAAGPAPGLAIGCGGLLSVVTVGAGGGGGAKD
jgi:hypothetical protein